MNVLFMGTPEFAVPSLEALVGAGHTVVGVLTQPDRPKGRGLKLEPLPVKSCALRLGVPVYQPDTLRDRALAPLFETLQPDVIAVVAYGKLLPGYVLRFPRWGCINVHGSLLPKYRGAGPIQAAVRAGDRETGVTTMHMARTLDSGDMILSAACPIGPDDTAEDVHDRLMTLGASLLVETLARLEDGTAPRIPQDESQATFAPMLTREDGRLLWDMPAARVYDQARAMQPWPGAYAVADGSVLRLYALCRDDGGPYDAPAGTVRAVDGGLLVVCGDGYALRVGELQPSGKRRMPVADYARGHALPERFER